MALAVTTVVAAGPAAQGSVAGRGAVSPDSLAPAISRTYCGHHVWAISAIPARGFNPLTASAAELNANDYPVRPPASDAHEQAQWRKFAVSYRARPSSCASLRQAAAWARRLPRRHGRLPSAASTSTNWSGYVAHENVYSDAEAEWDEPTVQGVSGTDDFSSSWVGIGLGNSSSYPLMQAGSEADYLDDTGSATVRYYLWYEIYPAESSGVPVYTGVHPGNLVGAHVAYASSSAGCGSSTCVFFHIWDTSTGFNQEYVIGGDWLNDGHAEWIYERPCLDSGGKCWTQYLADAAPDFTEAQAVITGAGWFALGALPDVTMDMYNCAGTQELADPGGISSSGLDFDEHYLHHGDSFAC